MQSRWSYWLERMQSAFWIIPTAISAVVIASAFLFLSMDGSTLPFLMAILPDRPSSLEGARLILSSIATATMTVVGVLFSLTIVILQQVSAQYTPRAIENFIRSTASQLVLGFFIGTFGYCLVLLRLIRQAEGESDPGYELAVTIASLLAITCLALLIFYLHYVAKAIKSNHILHAIASQTVKSLKVLQHDLCSFSDPAHSAGMEALKQEQNIISPKTGYLQEVQWDLFPDVIKGRIFAAEIPVMPGDFIYESQVLGKIHSRDGLDPKLLACLARHFQIDIGRTNSQDPRFGIKQMTDIALKALSPGINDPTTAIEAIQQIGRAFVFFVENCHHDGKINFKDGSEVRIRQLGSWEFFGQALDQLLCSGKDFAAVIEEIKIVLTHCRACAKHLDHILAIDGYLAQAAAVSKKLEERRAALVS